jgi:hypothetical protein
MLLMCKGAIAAPACVDIAIRLASVQRVEDGAVLVEPSSRAVGTRGMYAAGAVTCTTHALWQHAGALCTAVQELRAVACAFAGRALAVDAAVSLLLHGSLLFRLRDNVSNFI